MSGICKSANRNSRYLSRRRIILPVPGNCGNVLLSWWTIRGGGGAFDRVVRSGWCTSGDLVPFVPLLSGRGLTLRAKGRLYSACVSSMTLCGNETWPVQ